MSDKAIKLNARLQCSESIQQLSLL
jgi:hypothetical protein